MILMDYEDYYHATANQLLNNQQLKIIFEPRKTNWEELPFVPYIAIGGVIFQPMPPEAVAHISTLHNEMITKLGNLKFGEKNFDSETAVYGFSIRAKTAVASRELSKNYSLIIVSMNFAKGELWLGHVLYDFDEIFRDMDRFVRLYIDAFPEYRYLIVEILKKSVLGNGNIQL